jgi:hypothetical protein
MTTNLKLILPDGFDERAAQEMGWKGWISVVVEVSDGSRYPVYFSDPVRLQQDLTMEAEQGKPWFAEPGLVIIPHVTLDAIERTIDGLWQQGFFASLRPIATE